MTEGEFDHERAGIDEPDHAARPAAEAARLVAILKAEGVSQSFGTAFEGANPEARRLVLAWLLLGQRARA